MDAKDKILITVTSVGWVVTISGWFIAYGLGRGANRMDREHSSKIAASGRRRGFLSFLAGLISKALDSERHNVLDAWWLDETRRVHEEATQIFDDLKPEDRDEFSRLVKAAAPADRMHSQQLDNLKKFVENLKD